VVEERGGSRRPARRDSEDADPTVVERIWSYQVRPYLAEHWFERPAELDQLDRDVRALIAERS
jgi:hypothetical protein